MAARKYVKPEEIENKLWHDLCCLQNLLAGCCVTKFTGKYARVQIENT